MRTGSAVVLQLSFCGGAPDGCGTMRSGCVRAAGSRCRHWPPDRCRAIGPPRFKPLPTALFILRPTLCEQG